MMREGDLLEGDEDLDIGLWADQSAGLKRLLPLFKKAGYRRLKASYKGLDFQYNFAPGRNEGRRNIDISLYRRRGEYAWCPEYYFKINPARVGKRRAFCAAKVRRIFRRGWRETLSMLSLKLSISSWPWRSFINLGTWWIPAEFFDNLIFNPGIQAYIPVNWDSYLKFRYGKWDERAEDWFFHRDDGGFRDLKPEEILGKQL